MPECFYRHASGTQAVGARPTNRAGTSRLARSTAPQAGDAVVPQVLLDFAIVDPPSPAAQVAIGVWRPPIALRTVHRIVRPVGVLVLFVVLVILDELVFHGRRCLE